MGRATRRSMLHEQQRAAGAPASGASTRASVRIAAGRLQDAPGEQGQRGGEAERAAPVQAGRPRVARFAQRGRGDRQRDRADQRARQEHRPPAQRVQQRSGQHRPGGQAHAEAGAEQAEGARAALVGIGLVQRRRAAGQRGGCAPALHGAQRVQPDRVGRQAQRQRHQHEQTHSAQEHALAAAGVGQRAGSHQQAAEAEHEGIGDPGQRLRAAAQVAADGGRGQSPPAKLNGNISAAVQTASRVQARAGSGVGKSGAWLWRGRAA